MLSDSFPTHKRAIPEEQYTRQKSIECLFIINFIDLLYFFLFLIYITLLMNITMFQLINYFLLFKNYVS